MDLFHQLACFLHPHAPGGAEGKVVGAEGCSSQAKTQARMPAQIQKGPTPDGAVRLIGVNPEMMGFVRDGQEHLLIPVAEFDLKRLLLATGSLVTEKPSIRVVRGASRPVPEIQTQPELGCSALPLTENGRAVAENERALKPALRLHHLKGQQGSKRLASTWTGVDQHISP